jgi:hypothetical protein
MNATHQSKFISRGTFLRMAAFGVPLLSAASAMADSSTDSAAPDAGNLRAFIELARSDIRAEKDVILAENMDFTQDEAADFWPVQREYNTALEKLLDERNEHVRQYLNDYKNQSITDSEATKLANQMFDIEEKRTELKRKYFKKICKVIPAIKAARFFQIEYQLNTVIDLRLAAAVPLIK